MSPMTKTNLSKNANCYFQPDASLGSVLNAADFDAIYVQFCESVSSPCLVGSNDPSKITIHVVFRTSIWLRFVPLVLCLHWHAQMWC